MGVYKLVGEGAAKKALETSEERGLNLSLATLEENCCNFTFIKFIGFMRLEDQRQGIK